MTLSLLNSMLQRVSDSPRWPLLLYAATWTTLLTVTVAIASFSPELAFVSVITNTSPRSSSSSSSDSNSLLLFSRACSGEESVRVPLDIPVEVVCLPAPLFRRSKMDILVPPLFAAVIVAFSAFLVRALALWEVDVEVG